MHSSIQGLVQASSEEGPAHPGQGPPSPPQQDATSSPECHHLHAAAWAGHHLGIGLKRVVAHVHQRQQGGGLQGAMHDKGSRPGSARQRAGSLHGGPLDALHGCN